MDLHVTQHSDKHGVGTQSARVASPWVRSIPYTLVHGINMARAVNMAAIFIFIP